MRLETRLKNALENRRKEGTERVLQTSAGLVDFTSNDYLGFARDPVLQDEITRAITTTPAGWGSTGSRLLSGNSHAAMELEQELARFFGTEKALLFTSGYTANLGLLSALPQRGDTVFYDDRSHACIKEGVRLSLARHFSFRHNDPEDLERKLAKNSSGQTFIVAESVYSMDGDTAPLSDFISIASKHNARILLDEAHGLGVAGAAGKGLTIEVGHPEEVLACVYTFGKAIGVHGACVAGAAVLIDYLVNHARSFIYTTALPEHSIIAIREAFRHFELKPEKRQQLSDNISYFNKVLTQNEGLFTAEKFQGAWQPSSTAIQALVVPGNERIRRLARFVQQEGYDVRPILSPTVKQGSERLRICLHAYNSRQEIDGLISTLKQHDL